MVDTLETSTGRPTVVLRRFTVEEYHRMAEAGILHEDERIELIDGEIIRMAPIGGRHARYVNDLAKWFILHLHDRADVTIQSPLQLSDGSEPEPDLMLLRPRSGDDRDVLPQPEDVLLVIEVADTSLIYDRDVKLPRYAAAGIPEVWIWDLERRRVLVNRRPAGDMSGESTIHEGGTLAPLAFPDVAISIEQILG
jgi:Uma2 family endonuclease